MSEEQQPYRVPTLALYREAFRLELRRVTRMEDTITRQRDLIRELVGALDEAMGWNWLSEDMPEEQALRIEHTLSRARKELGE